MQTGSYTTLFIVLGSIAFIVLLALTMRSVIRRDKAMIEHKPTMQPTRSAGARKALSHNLLRQRPPQT